MLVMVALLLKRKRVIAIDGCMHLGHSCNCGKRKVVLFLR